MNKQTLNVTLISRHDIEANWLESDYVPEQGEIIVYDIEPESGPFPDNRYEPYDHERFKIGDGSTAVSDLPFAVEAVVPAWARATSKPSYNLGEVSDTTSYVRMTAAERTKLSGISTEANAYTHPSYTARTGVPTDNVTLTHGGTFTVTQPVSDATGHITAMNTRTYTMPSETILSTGSATESSTLSHSGTFTAVTGIAVDGHKITPTTTTYTLPADNNTDTKVTQTVRTTDGSFPILLRGASAGTSTTTTTTSFGAGMTANPSTNTITATTFSGALSGNAATATKAIQDGNGNVIIDTYVAKDSDGNVAVDGDIEAEGGLYIKGTSTFEDSVDIKYGNVLNLWDENNTTVTVVSGSADGSTLYVGNNKLATVGMFSLDSETATLTITTT